jgi:hypothetical protein
MTVAPEVPWLVAVGFAATAVVGLLVLVLGATGLITTLR